MRSAGKYQVMGCRNGSTKKHGCQLSASKSVRIIEICLLGYLRDQLLSDRVIEQLAERANAFLAEEAARPRVDTAPLKATIREKEAAIKKLFQRIEGQENESLCQAYEKRIGDLQKEVNELKSQLCTLEARNVQPPAPLDLATLQGAGC